MAARTTRHDNSVVEKHTRAFRRAKVHTFIVRSLRVLLPVLAISATSMYFFYSKMSVVWEEGPGKGKAEINVTGRGLVMTNPEYRGFDEKNGSYVVRAKRSVQKFKTPHVFQLEKVEARVDNKQNQWLQLVAQQGTYDNEKKNLLLHSKIDIKTSTQMYATLQSAEMNLTKKTISGQGPVKVGMPQGTIYAEKVRIFPSQNRLYFQNKVQLHINSLPQKSQDAKAGNGNTQSIFTNKNEPIDVAAESLEINDKASYALFQGEVSAVQSDMTLQAQKLQINYLSKGNINPLEQSDNSGSQQIKSVEASENVLLTSGEGRYVSAGYTKFDNEKQIVTLTEKVKVSQGKNILTGDKLVIDLKKRHSFFPPIGRVSGKFIPANTSKKKAAKKKSQKPQSLAQTFSQAGSSNNGPLTVYANSLDIYDQKKLAIFNGNVEVQRGGNSIRSGRLVLEYSGNTPVGGRQDVKASNEARVKKIIARNKVLIRTAHSQQVTSDRAVFDVPKEIVTIDGNVVLSQGKNVLKGEKLVINLRSGKYNFINEVAKNGATGPSRLKGSDGRVRVMIIPGTVQKNFRQK